MNDAAADTAFAIGNLEPTLKSDLGSVGGEIAYVVAHGALGCAASAAEGTGCAGGAIGGATSAALTPYIGTAVVGNGVASQAQIGVITALAALAGATTSGLAGANALGGANEAENEALNNCSAHGCWQDIVDGVSSTAQSAKATVSNAFGNALAGVERWIANPSNQSTLWMTNIESSAAPEGSAETTVIEEALPQIVADETVVTVKAASSSPGTGIQTYWPSNGGFLSSPTTETLDTGYQFSRYGGFFNDAGEFQDFGSYVAPTAVPFEMRSLPAEALTKPLTTYEVVEPIPGVLSGPAAPAFNQFGLGTQHQLPMTIQDYLDQGYIKIIKQYVPSKP